MMPGMSFGTGMWELQSQMYKQQIECMPRPTLYIMPAKQVGSPTVF